MGEADPISQIDQDAGSSIEAATPPASRPAAIPAKPADNVPLGIVYMIAATVLVVDSQNVIEQRRVRLGSEDSTYVEAVSGLAEGERVILGNRSLFRAGEKVQPHEVAATPAKSSTLSTCAWAATAVASNLPIA